VFTFVSILLSFTCNQITAVTGLPFGKLSYNRDVYGEQSFVGQIPFDVPLSDYMIVYLCFSVVETALFGVKRTRYQEEIGIRTGGVKSYLLLPLFSALGVVSFDLCMQPQAHDSNLWNYDLRVPVYENNTMIGYKNPSSVVAGDFYYGAPAYALIGVAVATFSSVLVYLLVEYIIDRVIIALDQSYRKKYPLFVSAVVNRFLPSLYGTRPDRYTGDAFVTNLCTILPLLCCFSLALMYAVLGNPPYVRVIAIVTLLVPILIPFSRMGYNKPEK
jgi:hypothetical protein